MEPSWQEYERQKRAWLLEHPEATAEEIGKAFREIAEKLRL
jgi:hypothetical protein